MTKRRRLKEGPNLIVNIAEAIPIDEVIYNIHCYIGIMSSHMKIIPSYIHTILDEASTWAWSGERGAGSREKESGEQGLS
jgi:hypothetical protein